MSYFLMFMSLPLICQIKLNIILAYRICDLIKLPFCLKVYELHNVCIPNICALLNLDPVICCQIFLDGFVNVYSFLLFYYAKV